MLQCNFARTGQGLPRFGRPSAAVSTHTHVCCRISHLGVAPKCRNVTKVWPTEGCCEHTYTEVSQQKSTPGCTQGSRAQWVQRFGGPVAAVSTHMCLEDYVNSRLHPTIKDLAGRLLLRAKTCVSQNKSSKHMCVVYQSVQGSTQGSKVTKVWPTSCCCEHAHHTRVLQNKSIQGCTPNQGSLRFGRPRAAVSNTQVRRRIKPTQSCAQGSSGQGAPGFGRPHAAASTHTHKQMCVAG